MTHRASLPLHIAIACSPVAPVGHGLAGGMLRMMESTFAALLARGFQVTLFAPEGSVCPVDGVTLHPIPGVLQPTQAAPEQQAAYPMIADGVLSHMWHALWAEQDSFDLIVNLAHDWLPFYLTPTFRVPVVHIPNLGDVCAATTDAVRRVAAAQPNRVAVFSRAQADDLGLVDNVPVLSFGLDLARYRFCEKSEGYLIWAGRISPEKGIEDSLEVARRGGEQLVIAGAVNDDAYWQTLQRDYAHEIDYRGMCDLDTLQTLLGGARALLQTQKWCEAFGIVTVEAMACGTPIIGYQRGANAELIADGVSGFLTAPDDVAGCLDALSKLGHIDRARCRAVAEERFSVSAFGQRLCQWIEYFLPGKDE